MNIEFDNNIPIYVQLLDYMKTYIISERIMPNDKLPSVRELASMFKVNPNTMQKALMELEDIGLIYTERTNGKYVTSNKKLIERIRNEYANKVIDEYFIKMKKIGIYEKDATNYLKERNENNGIIKD